jgi:coenzyme Q-binding protein COQ10
MFDLVADVQRYPEFLPWCLAARIRERREDTLLADLVIGFKMVRERFTSRVHLDRPGRTINVAYADGPFKHMANHWRFEPQADGGCLIDFYVDFEFRSMLLQKLIGVLFNEAVRRMVSAFEGRAKQLYGEEPAG